MSGFSRQPEAIAGLPTSISERREPRSVGLSVERKIPVGVAKQDPIPGKPICVARRIRSIGEQRYRWRKVSSLVRKEETRMDQAQVLDDLMEQMVADYIRTIAQPVF